MKLTLYYQQGTRSQRVRWILEELELAYSLKIIDLFKSDANSEEFRNFHPLGQLPVLQIDESIMLESGAIVQWLADYFPDKQLSPALTSPLRREFNQWMFFCVTNLETPAWEIMLHKNILPKATAVKEIIPFATEKLIAALTVINDTLTDKQYFVGNRFTAADIMITYLLTWYPEHLDKFANLTDYFERQTQRPAYIRSQAN